MSEDGDARCREPKTVYEERELVVNVILSSTKYKKKWAVTIFGEWQISRSVIASVLDKEGSSKATIHTRSHSFLLALKKWMK